MISSEVVATVKIFVGASISLAGAALLGLYQYQKSLVYPSSLNQGRTYHVTPDVYSMPYQELALSTEDGVTLDCFLLKQPVDRDYTGKTVVILGPNAGNSSHCLPIAEIFYKQFKYNVFLYSYRGYGKSTGTASENGLKTDARTVLLYLAQDKQYRESEIYLYGRLLGGAVSVYMAAQSSQYWRIVETEEMNETVKRTEHKYPRLSGVILENTFLSLPKVVPYIFPFLRAFTGLVTERWPSEEEIKNIEPGIPFLFLSGLNDEIVPPAHMKGLYELCPAELKDFRSYPKGYHNNTCNQRGYWNDVHNFIEG